MTGPASPSPGGLDAAILGVPESEYGPHYREHVLEVYKTYLELADHISERREKANSFFLAVNAALVALLAKDALGDIDKTPRGLQVLIPIAGSVMCFLWYRIIRSYRDLNSAKFKVIHAIERSLPLRPYDAEWESVGRGKDKKKYLPFTHVEIAVPWLFLVFHLILVCGTGWTAWSAPSLEVAPQKAAPPTPPAAAPSDPKPANSK